jgi:hypothetical protein
MDRASSSAHGHAPPSELTRKRSRAAPARMPRLVDLAATTRISNNAKSIILTELKELGYIPEDTKTSNAAITREKDLIASTLTPYGPLLLERDFRIGGDSFERFPVQNPLAILSVAMESSERFSQYVRNAIKVHGKPSAQAPWGLVLYFDEVTCGNPLAQGTKRKVQGVYWTLYDLGMQALCDECAWFEVVAFQDAKVRKFEGAMTHLIEQILLLFFDKDGHDLRTGLVFNLMHYGTLMLVAKVEIIIADIKALVEVVCSNGPTATLPCFECARVVSYKAKQHYDAIRDDDTFVTLSCLDPSKCGIRDTANVKRTLRDIADAHAQSVAGNITKAMFTHKQQFNGYKYVPNNVVTNGALDLDIIHCVVFDWMHLVFQTGCWNRELWAIFKIAQTAGICDAYRNCGEYTRAFTWPGCGRRYPGGTVIFSDEHYGSCNNTDSGYFKASASQGLALYRVCAKFLQAAVLPHARDHALLRLSIESYLKLCDVIDLLCCSKDSVFISADKLRASIAAWSHALHAAYGQSMFWPKTHKLAIHLADQLQRRKGHSYRKAFLPACWFQERHHKVIKRNVVGRCNTTSMEWGLCRDLIAHTLHDLKRLPTTTGLVNPHAAPKRMVATLSNALGSWVDSACLQTATEARHGPMSIHRGDVVLFECGDGRMSAGDIWFFIYCTEMGCIAFVSNWKQLPSCAETDDLRFSVVSESAPYQVQIELCVATCVCHFGNDVITVVRPTWL